MADLLTRIEITKLAAETGLDEESLAFLADRSPQELRTLRGITTDALFARNEERVRMLATLSRRLPPPLTAKIAERALGPMLSGRISGVLEPDEAARLAEHVDHDFLAKLSAALDPKRVAGIVRDLPDELVIDVGRRLLAAGDYLTLGRFVAVVAPDVALAVVDGASGAELLQVVLYTDDTAALDALLDRLPEGTVAAVVEAAHQAGAYDALSALLTLP